MINKDIEGNYCVDLLAVGAKLFSGGFCVVFSSSFIYCKLN